MHGHWPRTGCMYAVCVSLARTRCTPCDSRPHVIQLAHALLQSPSLHAMRSTCRGERAGRLLRELSVPGALVCSLAWDARGERLAIATGASCTGYELMEGDEWMSAEHQLAVHPSTAAVALVHSYASLRADLHQGSNECMHQARLHTCPRALGMAHP